MSNLQFNLDEDLLDVFSRLQQNGGEITLDTVLLIQLLRRLDELGAAGFDEPASDAGVTLTPVAAPVTPRDPLMHDVVQTIQAPNQALIDDLQSDPHLTEPLEPVDLPAADQVAQPTSQPQSVQPSAQPTSRPTQPSPTVRPTNRPVNRPVAQPVRRPATSS
ncbi:MAG: hypothetical protein AAFV88_14080 [Planctomycetota bacterium]